MNFDTWVIGEYGTTITDPKILALMDSAWQAARRTVSGQDIERVSEPEAKAWAAARSMGCAEWIKEWVPQLRTVSGQEAEPVCWITREQLTRVEDEGEDAWVYWAETGHVAEPDEVALYAAPIPATEQEKS